MICIRPNYRRNGPGYGFAEEPETGWTCPKCGRDVEWWRRPLCVNADGMLCHEECMEVDDGDD